MGKWVTLNVPGGEQQHGGPGDDEDDDTRTFLYSGRRRGRGGRDPTDGAGHEHTKSYTLRGLAKDTSYEVCPDQPIDKKLSQIDI